MISLKIFSLCLICKGLSGASVQKVKQKTADRGHVMTDFLIIIFISVTLKSRQEQHYIVFFLFTFLLFVLRQVGAQEAAILKFYMASRRARNLFPLLSGRKKCCSFATD